MTTRPPDAASYATLRAGLEAWEHEAAAYWDCVIRSPDVLRRVGRQFTDSLAAKQRIETALRRGITQPASIQEDMARDLFALEHLTAKIAALAERIEHLERVLRHD